MKDFAVIGLGSFGRCMLESLVKRGMHVVVIDCDDEKIQRARDLATKAIKADALNFELLQELFPEPVQCAIVDMGHQMERSILITNYLHKLEIPDIVVEAANDDHAEILRIVGATKVVFPEQEAAERLAGMLGGRGSLDFFAVAEDFSLIEAPIPDTWIGQTVLSLNLRQERSVNVVAVRQPTVGNGKELWRFPDPETAFQPGEIVLLAGKPQNLERVIK